MLSSKLWTLNAESVPEVMPDPRTEEITRYNGIDLTLLVEKLSLQLLLSFLYQELHLKVQLLKCPLDPLGPLGP